MRTMRAKVYVSGVVPHKDDNQVTLGETLTFNAVAKSGGYPEDGSDENNTYARWSPNARFEIHVANPALFGKFEAGREYYVDFTPADGATPDGGGATPDGGGATPDGGGATPDGGGATPDGGGAG